MRRIWNQKKTAAEAQKTQSKESPAKLRLQKELGELSVTKDTTIEIAANISEFTMTYRPSEGYYKGGQFKFQFEIGDGYPHDAPKVRCLQTIYHPNIDTEGHVCLNILREDWKPVLNIQAVIFGLHMLFQEPNPDDPLNKDAAKLMVDDAAEFGRTVRSTMRGRRIGTADYDHVLIEPAGRGY
ncbi:NEDD8-conjugating protein ubc12 [Coemansia biformis]|uniref:NEDD8-conjugating enzyme UBC12 n=1 Tax=Coemansia biformis TaxID=1286918 RepID=A0A9W8CVZ9_9FUNG|nr:NEDD8-conjugating protein ubc12 [Coemansia biformis]